MTEDTWRIFRIMAEFVEGFETLSPIPRAVTVFGSARARPGRRGLPLRGGARAGARQGRPRRDHRRRPRPHGGGQQGRLRGRRPVDRRVHRAAARGEAERLPDARGELPLLLRAQGHVRQVHQGLRDPAGRLRHARRAVRGAHAGADEEGARVPGDPRGRGRVLGRPARPGSARRCCGAARSAPRTWRCCSGRARRTRCSRSSRRARSPDSGGSGGAQPPDSSVPASWPLFVVSGFLLSGSDYLPDFGPKKPTTQFTTMITRLPRIPAHRPFTS